MSKSVENARVFIVISCPSVICSPLPYDEDTVQVDDFKGKDIRHRLTNLTNLGLGNSLRYAHHVRVIVMKRGIR